MRRATGILIGILLGALASGLGVGYFFIKRTQIARHSLKNLRKLRETPNRRVNKISM